MRSDHDSTTAATTATGVSLGPVLRVLVLADLLGGQVGEPTPVAPGGLEACLASFEPSLQLRVPNRLGIGAPELACTLAFRTLQDFNVDRLSRAHPLIQALIRVRAVLTETASGQISPGAVADRLLAAAGDGELSEALRERRSSAPTGPTAPSTGSAVDSLLGMVTVPATGASPGALSAALAAALAGGTEQALAALAAVDHRLTLQLSAVSDAAPVRDLEAAWRGLAFMHSRVPSGAPVRIEVQPTPKADFLDAFYDAHFDREHAGEADPALGLVVLGFGFDRSPRDIEDMQHAARMAASLGVPFVGEAAPEFFGVRTLPLAVAMPDLARKCRGPEYAKWSRLRTDESSLWLALAFNRPLLRPAWGEPGAEAAAFVLDASAVGGANRPLYGAGSWALATSVVQGYAAEGLLFPAAGNEGPAVLSGLATRLTRLGKAEPVAMAAEVALTDQKALELIESGFAPLVCQPGTDRAYFLSAPSTHAVTRYDTEDATSASFRAATLPYQLFASAAARALQGAARTCPAGRDDSAVAAHVHAALLAFLGTVEPSPRPEEAEVEVAPALNAPHLWDVSVRLRPGFGIYGGSVDLVLGTQAAR